MRECADMRYIYHFTIYGLRRPEPPLPWPACAPAAWALASGVALPVPGAVSMAVSCTVPYCLHPYSIFSLFVCEQSDHLGPILSRQHFVCDVRGPVLQHVPSEKGVRTLRLVHTGRAQIRHQRACGRTCLVIAEWARRGGRGARSVSGPRTHAADVEALLGAGERRREGHTTRTLAHRAHIQTKSYTSHMRDSAGAWLSFPMQDFVTPGGVWHLIIEQRVGLIQWLHNAALCPAGTEGHAGRYGRLLVAAARPPPVSRSGGMWSAGAVHAVRRAGEVLQRNSAHSHNHTPHCCDYSRFSAASPVTSTAGI